LPKLPQELESSKEIRKKLDLDENKPFVFAPISGPPKESNYLIKKLIQTFKRFTDEFQIVMSLGSPEKTNVAEKRDNLTIYNWIPNRFEYMKACDILITRGGHETITQSISYAKPLIIIPTPNHSEQKNNAKKAVDLGVAELIEQDNLSKKMILESIRKINTEDARKKRERIQKKVLRINGIEMATEMIAEAVEMKRLQNQ
jgi:uncharacterized protein (TIGR00661 family)